MDAFARGLKIAAKLVDEGILEKRDTPSGGHAEYVLTERGLELQPVLLAMTHWGDKHRPHPKGERGIFVDREKGEPIRPMSVVAADGRVLKPREIRATPGPAAGEFQETEGRMT